MSLIISVIKVLPIVVLYLPFHLYCSLFFKLFLNLITLLRRLDGCRTVARPEKHALKCLPIVPIQVPHVS